MATKCIVIGEEGELKIKGVSINLLELVDFNGLIAKNSFNPEDFSFLELISKGYTSDKRDLIFGHDGERNKGIVFLGHWNDGIV